MSTVILDSFKTKNSFSVDCNGKGKFAENVFLEYFFKNEKNANKTLFDVRNNKEYQEVDIDFVIDNEGGSELPTIDDVFYKKNRFIKVEVKYNGPALKSGKIAFEVVSHSRRGWGCTSRCDYMFVVFGEDESVDKYKVKKIGMIDFKKWTKFIDNKSNKTETYVNEDENKIVNIMTYLKDMEKDKVLTFIN